MSLGANTKMRSKSLAEPGDVFPWRLQVCTFWCGRAFVTPLPFLPAEQGGYPSTVCPLCHKRRRGQQRPHWYIDSAADLPREGETVADWEARKRADPGVFR